MAHKTQWQNFFSVLLDCDTSIHINIVTCYERWMNDNILISGINSCSFLETKWRSPYSPIFSRSLLLHPPSVSWMFTWLALTSVSSLPPYSRYRTSYTYQSPWYICVNSSPRPHTCRGSHTWSHIHCHWRCSECWNTCNDPSCNYLWRKQSGRLAYGWEEEWWWADNLFDLLRHEFTFMTRQ